MAMRKMLGLCVGGLLLWTALCQAQTGSVQVTLAPAGAITAGAQWNVDGGVWQASGATVTGLSPGGHDVYFLYAPGWASPVSTPVTITASTTTPVTGTYSQLAGSLTVELNPPAAFAAGAQWNVGGGPWQNTGANVGGLTVGSGYTINYNTIAGWAPPPSASVTISNNTATTAIANYLQTAGAPFMTLQPLPLATWQGWYSLWDENIQGEYQWEVSSAIPYYAASGNASENLDWQIAPVLTGLYYGYMATGNTEYVNEMVACVDEIVNLAVTEPDGYPGWPAPDPDNQAPDTSTTYNADSILGEAAIFRPIVLMAYQMTTNPALQATYGAKGQSYIQLAETIYAKWVSRGGWRDVTVNGVAGAGMISVILPYGMDPTNSYWIDYTTRNNPGNGFSHPENKANEIALWLLAMWDATGNPEYQTRAAKWFTLLKYRMTLAGMYGNPPDGSGNLIWNYWQPAGPWDYVDYTDANPTDPKLWIGTHPNNGYYQIDTLCIVAAFEHGVVFNEADITTLVTDAKTSWTPSAWEGVSTQYYFNPSSLLPGMSVSAYPASGTVQQVCGCIPNSLNPLASSAWPTVNQWTGVSGSGALNGTIVSVTWNGSTGTIVVQPAGGGAQVTLDTNTNSEVWLLRLWTSMVPYDVQVQQEFEENEDANPGTAYNWGPVYDSYYLWLHSTLTVQSTPPTGLIIGSTMGEGYPTNYTIPGEECSPTVNLQAPAADPAGYTFSQWAVNGTPQTAGLKSITFAKTEPTTAVAQYTLNTYALTVQSTPPTGLSIGSSSADGGTTNYTVSGVSYGTSVNLQAPAADPTGYTFSKWTVNGAAQTAGLKSITFTMAAAATAVAQYTLNTYALTVQSTPPTGLVITSSSADGGTTNYTVPSVAYGTSVNLQAPATDPTGYTFSQWTVNGAAQTAGLKSITFTMTAAATAVAQYTLNTYTLTVQSTPPTGLSIGSSSADGGTTNYTASGIAYGTSVNLAAPATDPTGYTFSQWTVNGAAQTAGLKSITFTMAAATTAVAQYTLNTYALTVQSTPPTGLVITSSSADGGTTNYTVPSVAYGTNVNLQAPATDPAGYTFSQWTLNGTAQTAGVKSVTFTMAADATAVAQYQPMTYTLTVLSTDFAVTFASFGWLTNSENGVFFTTGDKLSGLIWSNGQFNIDGNPVFNGPVFTGAATLNYMHGGPPIDNPTFTDGIHYNAPVVNLNSVISGNDIPTIQNAANIGGVSEPSNNGNGYSLTFNTGGTFTLVKNGSGGPHGTAPVTLYSNAAISATNGAFYFQDIVQVSGTINGQVTIGTSLGNDIDITNNLVYSYPANPATMFAAGFNQSDPLLVSKCALVSGGNVVIDPASWADVPSDMYITASCASVTGSFENVYYTSSPVKTLHVYGGIVQYTRGAVGTTAGTGFIENYVFDTRFTLAPPPFLPVIFPAVPSAGPTGVSIGSNSGDGGTTNYTVPSVAYRTSVDLVAPATDPTGYTFSCWTLNGTPQPAGEKEITPTMPATAMTAVAVYTVNNYTLTVQSTPPTGIAVTSSSGDGGATNYTVPSVAYGTSVDLVAPATDPTGYTFLYWTLNGTAQTAGVKEITPTMPATATTAVAVYTLNTYTLTVQSTPPTGIVITSGSGYGGTTNYTVPSVAYGTSVDLVAPATDPTGYTFSCWTLNGALQPAGEKEITPTVTSATTAVAQYTLNSYYTLTVQSTPPTGLSIGSSTGNNGTTNYYTQVSVVSGTNVNLAAPATDPTGYTFSQWTLNGAAQSAGQKTITFTMAADTAAVAQYTVSTYALTVQSTPPTGIVITSSSGYGGTTNYTAPDVASGTSVDLEAPATDPAGYTFSQWTVNGAAQTAGLKSITFTMTAATTAVAQYTLNTYTLTVQSAPLTGILITSSSSDGGTTDYTVPSVAYGTSVDLVAPATDPTGYTFSCWTLNGTPQPAGEKEITPTVTSPTTAVAQYTVNTCTLTVQSTPPTGIVITSSTADGGVTNYAVSSVAYGTSVNLSAPATDPAGYTFSQWTVNGAAQTAGQRAITFTMAADTTAVAQYTVNTYTLTVQATPPTGVVITSSTADGGVTNYTAPGITYGTIVNLAAPATDPVGYTFSQWTLTQTGGQNSIAFVTSGDGKSITFAMSTDITAVAQYTADTYALTVQSTPPSGIVITSSAGDGGTTNYTVSNVAYGTNVNVQAPATDPAGYTFSRWTVNGAAQSAGQKSLTFTMAAAATAVAQYTMSTYTLTVQSAPPTGLSIGSSTGDGATTNYTVSSVAYGTSVNLQAPATDPLGYTFLQWTVNGVAQTAGQKSITFTMAAATTATAQYSVSAYALTVQSTPPSGIVITSSTADGGTTNYTVSSVAYGTSVNLAAPATDPTGYTFSKWTVNGTAQTGGQKSITFTMAAATTATAQYTANTYTLTVQATPLSGIVITSSTADGGTTNYAVSSVAYGKSVNLAVPATAPTGYNFSRWMVNGAPQPVGLKSITFTMPATATTAVAVYTVNTYTLTVQSTPPTAVVITSSTSDGGATNYTVSSVAYGNSVNLAAPATNPTGYTFSRWTVNGAAQTAGQKSITFTMTAATTAVAQYTANTYTLTVHSTPLTGIVITSSTADGGTTNYTVSSVAYGTSVNLAAPATNPPGYTFSKWTVNGAAQHPGQKSITFTMRAATTATAQYVVSTYALTVQSTPPTRVVITSSSSDGGVTNYTLSSVAYGTSVKLAAPATNPAGYTFSQWTVNGAAQAAGQKSIAFTMTAATTAVAHYTANTYAVMVQSSPATGIVITSSTADGGTTDYTLSSVAYETSVKLAAPATDPTGYTFSRWTLNGTAQAVGLKSLSFTMPEMAMTAVAVYTVNTYTLTVQSTPLTAVVITSSTTDGGTTNYTVLGVAYGKSVNLAAPATDPTGYTFSQWTVSGAAQTAGQKSITFTMSAATTAVAQYTQNN
jgi:hypothetical protein